METDIAKTETELKLEREDLQQTIEQAEQKFETGLRFERRLKKNPVISMCLFAGLGFLYGTMTRKRSLFYTAALSGGGLKGARRRYSKAKAAGCKWGQRSKRPNCRGLKTILQWKRSV